MDFGRITRLFRINTISYGVVLLLLNCFFLFTADSFFGGYASYVKGAIISYLLMNTAFIAHSDMKNPLFSVKLLDAFLKFSASFLLALTVFSFFHTVDLGYVTLSGVPRFYLIFFSIVVAFNEDLFFCRILPDVFGIKGVPFSVPVALIFALFHLSVYQLDMFQMLIAFIASCLFQVLANNPRFGLPVTSGLHTAYNLVAVGYFSIVGVMI